MPSPFPGMDPFIESQVWEDFHRHFIEDIFTALVPRVRPRYVVRVEERVYVEYAPNRREVIRPDVSVVEGQPAEPLTAAKASTVAAAPFVLTLPKPQEEREPFITIRSRESAEVVTIIEVLSPTNKNPKSDGHSEYLHKRGVILQSSTHLVELDLLRGGERLPTVEPLPPADYYAFVSRADRRPEVEAYPWTLRQPLPAIPVPLAWGDPDVVLDLQEIFNTVYDRAGYDYSLDYTRSIEPPLSDADAGWVQKILASAYKG